MVTDQMDPEPAEPVEPAEPAEPVEPVEPAEPVEPVDCGASRANGTCGAYRACGTYGAYRTCGSCGAGGTQPRYYRNKPAQNQWRSHQKATEKTKSPSPPLAPTTGLGAPQEAY